MTRRIERRPDPRRQETPLRQRVRRMSAGRRFSFAYATSAVKPRRMQSYDSIVGPLVISGFSDLPQYRERAQRILGREVVTVYADMCGTVYQAAP